MNILVTLDSNYVFPLTVLLKSLMITNSESEFDIYVAHSSLTEEDFEKIKSAADLSRTRIHPTLVSAGILENAPVLKRITKETYYRLLMMDYLPQNVDRILYIDPDTVVLRDISPLYNIDFKGRTIPVTAHSMGSWYTSKNPACTVNGQQKRDCAYGCGTSETKDISATGHKDGNPYDGYCDICGAETDAVENCSCNCHKDGFMGFIWKIMIFFQKLFKTNHRCACGIAHY